MNLFKLEISSMLPLEVADVFETMFCSNHGYIGKLSWNLDDEILQFVLKPQLQKLPQTH